jgi:hypothetical protein
LNCLSRSWVWLWRMLRMIIHGVSPCWRAMPPTTAPSNRHRRRHICIFKPPGPTSHTSTWGSCKNNFGFCSGPLPSDGRGRIELRRAAYPTALETARDGSGCSLSRRTGEGQGEGRFVRITRPVWHLFLHEP